MVCILYLFWIYQNGVYSIFTTEGVVNFCVYYETIKWDLNKGLIKYMSLFLILDRWSENYTEDLHVSVGVMEDQKMNLRELHVSHTLSLGEWENDDWWF